MLVDLKEMLSHFRGLDKKVLEFERRAIDDPSELSAMYIKDTMNICDSIDSGIKAARKKIKAITGLKRS